LRKDRLHTPDGRYFVARGQLRRCTNPELSDTERRQLIKVLMQGRMAFRRVETDDAVREARETIEQAKTALGETGPVWWRDGAPDLSGQHPKITAYADWWSNLPDEDRKRAESD